MPSVNDILSRGWLKLNITASGNAQITGSIRIHAAILTPAAAAASIILYDAATQAGTDLIKLAAPANGPSAVSHMGTNGHVFSTGLSSTLAGVGAVAAVFYTLE